ncbi:MAG: CpsD/CapB family tyrosine-protein kinase [Pseudomonadota bacterium]|nr:CpsD/CapB family tyrosine-protein kinase [Pseudomonadota bacterium]
MAWIGLGVAALVFAAIDLIPDRYVAEAVILPPAGPSATAEMEAEARRLRAPDLLARLSDALRLQDTAEFSAPADPLRPAAALGRAADRTATALGGLARAAIGWAPPAPVPLPPDRARARAAARLADRISVAPVAGGGALVLRAAASEPGLAALIANSLADLRARDRLSARIAEEERAVRLLAHRLEGLTARLAAAETAAEARRAALSRASAAELAEAERRLRVHETALEAYRSRGVGEPLALTREDEGRARREWRAAQDRLETMRGDLSALRAAAEARSREDPDLLARAGEARALGALRDAMLSRLRAAAASGFGDDGEDAGPGGGAGAGAEAATRGPERSELRLAVPAAPPTAPARPTAGAAMLWALLAGFLAAGVAGAAAEAADRSLRSLAEAGAEARLPALAALPRVPRLAGLRMRLGASLGGGLRGGDDGGAAAGLLATTRARPAGRLAEATRGLRVALTAGPPPDGGGGRIIAVTSPGPREGRSETAALLAESCARVGLRTVLVDADIRAPGQAARFGLQGATDLLEALEGGATLDEVLWTDAATGLTVLPAEPAPAWRADLLAGPGMAALLSALRRRFEVVVLDTPPLLSVADGLALAARADRVLLLARDGVTRRDALRAAARMLADGGVRPAGVALTDAFDAGPGAGRALRPAPPRARFGRFSEGFGE